MIVLCHNFSYMMKKINEVTNKKRVLKSFYDQVQKEKSTGGKYVSKCFLNEIFRTIATLKNNERKKKQFHICYLRKQILIKKNT